MPDRILLDGTRVKEAAHLRSISITTRVPAKWAAVDLETGQVWVQADKGGWEQAEAAVKRLVATAANAEPLTPATRSDAGRRREAAKA